MNVCESGIKKIYRKWGEAGWGSGTQISRCPTSSYSFTEGPRRRSEHFVAAAALILVNLQYKSTGAFTCTLIVQHVTYEVLQLYMHTMIS